MKVAMLAAWPRREELQDYAEDLRAGGVTVVSRWLWMPPAWEDDGRSLNAPSAILAQTAQDDLEDIAEADIVISFTEPAGSLWTRGSRHAEHGFALALALIVEGGPRLCVVGPRENVFHHHPKVYWFETWPLGRGWVLAWEEAAR
jgi:hypothetical protein